MISSFVNEKYILIQEGNVKKRVKFNSAFYIYIDNFLAEFSNN